MNKANVVMTSGHIRAARAFKGWTQKELAERLGVSLGLVRLAETGGAEAQVGNALHAIAARLQTIGIMCMGQSHSPHGPWYAVGVFEEAREEWIESPPVLSLVIDND